MTAAFRVMTIIDNSAYAEDCVVCVDRVDRKREPHLFYSRGVTLTRETVVLVIF